MTYNIPVFACVSKVLTKEIRLVMLRTNAELQGAICIVVNAPYIKEKIDVASTIFNVSVSVDTPKIVAKIRNS